MAKIEKLAVSLSGLMPTFVKVAEAWRPPKLKTEAEYRTHLADYVRGIVPDDARVEKNYQHRGTTMDVYVSWKGIFQSDDLVFKVKRDLTKKAELDRLVGQIEGLEPTKNKVIVVLVGKTDDGLVARLRDKYANLLKGGFEHPTLAIACPKVEQEVR